MHFEENKMVSLDEFYPTNLIASYGAPTKVCRKVCKMQDLHTFLQKSGVSQISFYHVPPQPAEGEKGEDHTLPHLQGVPQPSA